MKEPEINVGIVNALEIAFTLNAKFLAKGETVSGKQRVFFDEGGISWNGNVYRELTFTPLEDDASFSLEDVTIGINFHWERQETQTFLGTLRLVVDEGKITAINQVPAEDYLTSVISSEMNATSSLEFLKAHAVISRSWLLAQIEKRKALSKQGSNFFPFLKTETEYIRWYDREDHTLFDVCADDHCQRYQGLTRAAQNPYIQAIIKATRGEVLTYEGEICDTRFSKCCGGVTEEFEHCWEPVHHPYLSSVADRPDSAPVPDLTQEAEAEKWIRSYPPSFCQTSDTHLLSIILNQYDQSTQFYRWEVSYSQEELSELVYRKSGIPFGKIIDLLPQKRGKSGRIEELKIVGSERSYIIGKELEIRRVLSESHLYSSAFVVDRIFGEDPKVPTRFVLKGAGWGHGVGLCQIGAAVMSTQGYNYQQILAHYFPGSNLDKRY